VFALFITFFLLLSAVRGGPYVLVDIAMKLESQGSDWEDHQRLTPAEAEPPASKMYQASHPKEGERGKHRTTRGHSHVKWTDLAEEEREAKWPLNLTPRALCKRRKPVASSKKIVQRQRST
jgi:hypothetical protein